MGILEVRELRRAVEAGQDGKVDMNRDGKMTVLEDTRDLVDQAALVAH